VIILIEREIMKNWLIKNMCMFSAMLTMSYIAIAVFTCLTLDKGVDPTKLQSILLTISVGGMVLQMVTCLCSRWLPRWYACDAMGWHIRPVATGFDGASLNGQCPRCHKKVMQDSQGNWF
jgi:hypothetical protein